MTNCNCKHYCCQEVIVAPCRTGIAALSFLLSMLLGDMKQNTTDRFM
jgi:hypothetical protein